MSLTTLLSRPALRAPGALRLAALLLLALPGLAPAQVSLGAAIRADRYMGAAVRTGGANPLTFRPLRPEMLEVNARIGLGRIGVDVGGSLGDAGLAGGTGNEIIQPGPVWTVAEFAPHVVLPVSGTLNGSGVRLLAGPILGRWTLESDPTETLFGAQAGLEFATAIGRSFSLTARAALAVVGSPIAQDQLDPDDTRGSLSRRSFALGARWKP